MNGRIAFAKQQRAKLRCERWFGQSLAEPLQLGSDGEESSEDVVALIGEPDVGLAARRSLLGS